MRSVLLDTNTLLLWLVGSVEPDRVGGKRLEQFDLDDFKRLRHFLNQPLRHVSLPNVLTEVSNFVGAGEQTLGKLVVEAFKQYCSSVEEIYEASKEVAETFEFSRLRLTDAAIYKLATSDVTVFTTDYPLGNRLEQANIRVVNLMHYKTPR